WQLYEQQPVVSTCHLIDEGIDSGKIIEKKILNLSFESYEKFRASVYPEMAKFAVEILLKISSDKEIVNNAKRQDESEAIYRKYIGDENIEILKKKFPVITNEK
ncbi:MAG: hypothetical protein PHD97_12000, partial [Bacteroidales bacterium]|nr:hypothetical protein [Bacteroidales bacterium]